MTYINTAKFVLINSLEIDHSMIESRRLENVAIFIQAIYIYIIDINKVYIKNILISSNVSYGEKGFKRFSGYRHGNKTKSNCV